MYIDKVVFLLSVLLPMQYRFIAPLESRNKDDIWKVLRQHIAIPRTRGINVDVVRTDPEGAIMALRTEINEAGCELNPGG
jgi:hypothetical protein